MPVTPSTSGDRPTPTHRTRDTVPATSPACRGKLQSSHAWSNTLPSLGLPSYSVSPEYWSRAMYTLPAPPSRVHGLKPRVTHAVYVPGLVGGRRHPVDGALGIALVEDGEGAVEVDRLAPVGRRRRQVVGRGPEVEVALRRRGVLEPLAHVGEGEGGAGEGDHHERHPDDEADHLVDGHVEGERAPTPTDHEGRRPAAHARPVPEVEAAEQHGHEARRRTTPPCPRRRGSRRRSRPSRRRARRRRR